MLLITKGPEPPALRSYRATPGNAYDGANFTPVKDAIRAALLRDQRHLCCYCMRRISAELRPTSPKPDAPREPWMKVEHWRPQEHHGVVGHLADHLRRVRRDDELAVGEGASQRREHAPLPRRMEVELDLVDDDHGVERERVVPSGRGHRHAPCDVTDDRDEALFPLRKLIE